MSVEVEDRVRTLACWKGAVDLEPLQGGMTNTNFLVRDGDARYVVRMGHDIPEHGIMRFNELAASRAAHAAGISPEVVYAEAGVMVLRFIAGKTLAPEDIRKPENLARIVPLIRRVHREIPRFFRGAVLAFWVFHVLRDYNARLKDENSRMARELPRLSALTDELEAAVGAVQVVFGHNDLLAANFMDDGDRLWLIDWDYAGYNTPLFDLGGLASNNGFNPDEERRLLESYYGAPVEENLWRQFEAMKCASLLRESMWSMVAEIYSKIDFDYVAYTEENMARFERAYEAFRECG